MNFKEEEQPSWSQLNHDYFKKLVEEKPSLCDRMVIINSIEMPEDLDEL